MTDQCQAVTSDGDRCSRPAQADGFCHQHGPEDETVDDADSSETTDEDRQGAASDDGPDTASAESDGADEESADGDDDTMDEDETTDDESTGDEETVDDDSAADETEDEAGDADPSDDGGATGIVAVRDTVREQVPALIGHDLDGVTSLMREEDGWLATVELVERHSVPDTQDILGQYEVTLAEDGSIHGYRRLETYRRAEGPPYEG